MYVQNLRQFQASRGYWAEELASQQEEQRLKAPENISRKAALGTGTGSLLVRPPSQAWPTNSRRVILSRAIQVASLARSRARVRESEEKEAAILSDMIECQGKSVDIGGYYHVDKAGVSSLCLHDPKRCFIRLSSLPLDDNSARAAVSNGSLRCGLTRQKPMLP